MARDSALGTWFTPTRAVVLAAVAYGVLAALVVGLDREVRWDEVTYLAQVAPGTPEVWFGPQRARGMTIVLAPVALFGAPTTLLRIWLIVVHAVALGLAYRSWARYAGWTGAAAAGVAAVGWVPLYFAVEGYPNLLVGFLAVAFVGHTLLWCRDHAGHGSRADRTGGSHRDLVIAAATLAAVAWLRPSESVWLAAGMTPVVLVLALRSAWRPIAAFLIGGFIGWLPWLIEGIVRFGGPFERLDAARSTSASGTDRNSLIQYLNLVEGPVRRVVEDPVLTGAALLFLTASALLVLLGIAQRLDTDRRRAAVVGAVTAGAMVAPYLLLNAGINLRYILPGLLLVAVPIGAGLTTIGAAIHRARSWTAAIVVIALLAGTAGWQAHLARTNAEQIAPLQARPVPLGDALADAAGGEPCAFLSNVQWPEIQWHSGCAGEVLDLGAPLLQCHDARRDLAALAADGHRVFVLARGEPPFSPAVAGWPVQRLTDPEDGVWRLYERPAELGPSDAPTIPPAEASSVPCPPSRAPDTSGATLEFRWTR